MFSQSKSNLCPVSIVPLIFQCWFWLGSTHTVCGWKHSSSIPQLGDKFLQQGLLYFPDGWRVQSCFQCHLDPNKNRTCHWPDQKLTETKGLKLQSHTDIAHSFRETGAAGMIHYCLIELPAKAILGAFLSGLHDTSVNCSHYLISGKAGVSHWTNGLYESTFWLKCHADIAKRKQMPAKEK